MKLHDYAIVVTLTARDMYLIKMGLAHCPLRNKIDGVRELEKQLDDIMSNINGMEI